MLPGTPSTKSKLARNVSTQHTRSTGGFGETRKEARHAHPTAYYLYNFLQQGADILSRQVKRKQPKVFALVHLLLLFSFAPASERWS